MELIWKHTYGGISKKFMFTIQKITKRHLFFKVFSCFDNVHPYITYVLRIHHVFWQNTFWILFVSSSSSKIQKGQKFFFNCTRVLINAYISSYSKAALAVKASLPTPDWYVPFFVFFDSVAGHFVTLTIILNLNSVSFIYESSHLTAYILQKEYHRCIPMCDRIGLKDPERPVLNTVRTVRLDPMWKKDPSWKIVVVQVVSYE